MAQFLKSAAIKIFEHSSREASFISTKRVSSCSIQKKRKAETWFVSKRSETRTKWSLRCKCECVCVSVSSCECVWERECVCVSACERVQERDAMRWDGNFQSDSVSRPENFIIRCEHWTDLMQSFFSFPCHDYATRGLSWKTFTFENVNTSQIIEHDSYLQNIISGSNFFISAHFQDLTMDGFFAKNVTVFVPGSIYIFMWVRRSSLFISQSQPWRYYQQEIPCAVAVKRNK